MPYVATKRSSREELTKLIRLIRDKFELKVGDQLPDQRGASELVGVSRTKYREAIVSLTFAGYIECFQGKPSVVIKDMRDI